MNDKLLQRLKSEYEFLILEIRYGSNYETPENFLRINGPKLLRLSEIEMEIEELEWEEQVADEIEELTGERKRS